MVLFHESTSAESESGLFLCVVFMCMGRAQALNEKTCNF